MNSLFDRADLDWHLSPPELVALKALEDRLPQLPFSYAILHNSEVIPASAITASLWLNRNLHKTQIYHHQIGGYFVSSLFSIISQGDCHFYTNVISNDNVMIFESWTRTLKETLTKFNDGIDCGKKRMIF